MKNYNYSDMNRLVDEVFEDFNDYKRKHPNLSFSLDDNSNATDEAITSVLIRTHKNGDVKIFKTRCNPYDIYDMNIGFALLMLRAMGVQYTPRAFEKQWFRAWLLLPTEKFIYENKIYTTEYVEGREVVALDEKGRTYHFKNRILVNPVK